MRSTTALALPMLFLTAPAAAQGAYADLTQIDREVAAFTGAPAGSLGGAKQPVDRRLRLARCASRLTLSWHGARRDTVRVECPEGGGWRIFVATSGGAQAMTQSTLVKRGERVTITVRGRGFAVSRAGEAMEGGAEGDWIRVRPADGSQPLRGRILRPGLVEIPIG